MTVALNGYEIAKSIGSNPAAFPDVRVELQKAMLTTLTAQLKSKKLSVEQLKVIRSALGAQAFSLVLEHLDKPLAAVTKTLDPHCQEQKGATAGWHRKHLDALASGALSPAAKAEKSPTKKAPAKAPAKSSLRVTEENFYPVSMTTAVGSRKKGG